MLPTIVEHLWSTKAVLDDQSFVGALLRSVFGYNDDPSFLEVVAYLGYVAVIGRAALMTLLPTGPRVRPRLA